MQRDNIKGRATLLAIMLGVSAYVVYDSTTHSHTRTVTATAYTSAVSQTDSTPYTPACGGDLRDGTPTVAVSNDLWKAGLRCGRVIMIRGQQFTVRDKMHKRWSNRIDIYHGDDLAAARAFGKRRLEINYRQEG